MVFVKCIKNEKLFSDVENLNQKFNEALKDLAESKKTTITLNEQLIIKENKVKAKREGWSTEGKKFYWGGSSFYSEDNRHAWGGEREGECSKDNSWSSLHDGAPGWFPKTL